MLTSITPLGERGRASRWSVTVTAYLIGSVAGGLAVGALAGALGGGLPLENAAVAAGAVAVLGLAALLAMLVELRRLPAPPGLQRQVDEDWLHRYRGWVYGLGYGAQLGTGLATIVSSTSLYVVLLLAVLTGSPAAGAVVGVVFGLVRALPVLGLRNVHTAAELTRAARRVEALAPVGTRATAAVLAVVALAAAGQLVVSGAAAGAGGA